MTALISLVTFYGTHPLGQRLAGWFWPNPNTAGAVFGLVTVAAAAAGLASGKSGWRIAYMTAAAVLLACTALTGCRAALVAAAATGVVCALAARAWRLLAGVLGAAVFLGVSVAAGWIGVDEWLARADSGRLELWAHFWSVGWQRPLLGEGMRQHLGFTISNGLKTDDPHNMLLYTFLRTGLVGVSAWVALMVSALLAGIRHWRRTGGPVPLALMLYLVAHGFFETAPPMENPDWFWVYLWIPVGIAAGVGLAPGLSPNLE
jgi:O-antigen ligase